jgi:hypothetical protein
MKPPYLLLADTLHKLFRNALRDWHKEMGEYGLAERWERAALAEGIDRWLRARTDGEFIRYQIVAMLGPLGFQLFDRRLADPERQLEQPHVPPTPANGSEMVSRYAQAITRKLEGMYQPEPFTNKGTVLVGKTIAHAVLMGLQKQPGHPAALLDLRATL